MTSDTPTCKRGHTNVRAYFDRSTGRERFRCLDCLKTRSSFPKTLAKLRAAAAQ